jgi:hypothetical protein
MGPESGGAPGGRNAAGGPEGAAMEKRGPWPRKSPAPEKPGRENNRAGKPEGRGLVEPAAFGKSDRRRVDVDAWAEDALGLAGGAAGRHGRGPGPWPSWNVLILTRGPGFFNLFFSLWADVRS